MKKLLRKLKIQKIIVYLCLLSSSLIFFTGVNGMLISKSIQSSVNSMYDYYNWSENIKHMENSILQIHLDLEKSSHHFDEKYIDTLKDLHNTILNEYNEYTATESDEEEQILLDKFITAYNQYYSLITNTYETLKLGNSLSISTEEELEQLFTIISTNLSELDQYVASFAIEEKDLANSLYKKTSIFAVIIIFSCIVIFTYIAYFIIKLLRKELATILAALNSVTSNDLSIEVPITGKNEFDEMKIYVNEMISNLSLMILSLQDKGSIIDDKSNSLLNFTDDLSVSANNILSSVENISSATENQASDLINITTSLNNFSKTIHEFINDLHFVNNSSNNINTQVINSSEKMDKLISTFNYIETTLQIFVEKISKLSLNINEVNDISKVINGLADQTNLLALNAAIESARVGEAGKGFAVVASEIQKLADESKKSANDITVLINDITDETNIISKDGLTINCKVKDSSLIINDAISSFKTIMNDIDTIIPKINNLTSASEIINNDSNSILDTIENSSSIAEEISASSEEIVASLKELTDGSKTVKDSSSELTNISSELQNEIAKFII